MLKADQLRVKALLAETITLLCKNGLHFKTKFSIEGLIGITLDDDDIFLVNINETIKAAESVQTDEDSNDATEQPPRSAKRGRSGAEGAMNKVSLRHTESPAPPTAKSVDTSSSIPPKLSSNCRTRSLRSSGRISPPSADAKPAELSKVSRAAKADPEIEAFDDYNDSVTATGNDSLPASDFGLSEGEFKTISSAPLNDVESYDDHKPLPAGADFAEPRSKRIRLVPLDTIGRSSMPVSTSGETDVQNFNVQNEQTKSEPPDVIEIKEESLSDIDSQQANYSTYDDYNMTAPYGGSHTEMMHGYVDSSMFQANSGFFVQQQREVSHNPDDPVEQPFSDWCDPEMMSALQCPKCEKAFSTESLLRKHMKRVHCHRFAYNCTLCRQGMHTKDDLRSHLVSKHNMKKNIRCPICTKEFGYRRALRRHVLSCHT